MRYATEVAEQWIIPAENFSGDYIESRLLQAPEPARPFLRSTLSYLYLDDGAKTLDRERLVASKPYLTPAELIVVRWLHTRSNGSERKNYGPDCVVSAKKTRYRCNRCKFPDVRVLQLDHVNGRGEGVKREFECLCANCHMVKSRENDWSKPL